MAILFTNCTEREQARFNRAVRFITRKECPVATEFLPVEIIKTGDYERECDQAAAYYPPLGLENSQARLVFNPAKGGTHSILINEETVTGLGFVHATVTQLSHLAHLLQFSSDHGNVYRFDQEKALAAGYYEFLLWSLFQANQIATRCHALVSWHELNGEASPPDGIYRFAQVKFSSNGLRQSLKRLAAAGNVAEWREGLWDLLEELCLYFGTLSFYQQQPRPENVDEGFPAEELDMEIGLQPCLDVYAILKRVRWYELFAQEQLALRQAILAIQEVGKNRFALRE